MLCGHCPDPTLAGVLEKILIANRGEIAVRVARAARELGIATVAVYSELDRDALHVRLANEAYALGGKTAAESYLNTAAILDAVTRSGADGVHPGYGFFSENADFARAITELGVAFIGPSPEAIEAMGDKVSSRKAALRGGAPIVPGTTEFASGSDEIRAFGEEHGWPIAIKAAFGGGGRGMKVVHSAGDVEEAMASAQREAKAFFGRDEVYVERYLTWPRHVEVQVVGDQHGNLVWVSTRDCSAQRRHQKLIEEAPAPRLPDGVEEAMGEAAVKAGSAVGYYNAGTVEFIYQDGDFFFLEMNTRLQVEHPVTEAITGINLVEWQIRVASGEPLPMSQDEVLAQRRGHAIEVRINAEDPVNGAFLPSPGRITTTRRAAGIRRPLRLRLSRWRRGVAVLRQPHRQVGGVGEGSPDGDRPHDQCARGDHRRRRSNDHPRRRGDPAPPGLRQRRALDEVGRGASRPHRARDVTGEGRRRRRRRCAGRDRTDGRTTHHRGGQRQAFRRDVVGARGRHCSRRPAQRGRQCANRAERPGSRPPVPGAAGSGSVTVPMQGTIVKVLVEVGQEVDAGQPIVVLEAMKMENQIATERGGTVREIKVAAGDTVGGGDVVAVIE